ncbi:unnamed protein product [Enterobius vermicularis]|uniref:BHLH domain-containing protein n=1 Tax=Enterobius vermicularis TaxID=51028 RepID=A0A0N4V181_ENTVE|nr:unnamed protein product [Enterobius vermicularis]
MSQHLAVSPYCTNYINCCASSSSSLSATSIKESGGLKSRRKKQISGEALFRQRKAANERERKRMYSINKGFDKLRLRLPTLPYEKKLSKVDTLKQAIKYIKQLSEMLNDCSPLRERTEFSEPRQGSTVILTSPKSFDSKVLSVSWWKSTEQYGEAIRDENGVPHVRCSKVWMPDVMVNNR